MPWENASIKFTRLKFSAKAGIAAITFYESRLKKSRLAHVKDIGRRLEV